MKDYRIIASDDFKITDINKMKTICSQFDLVFYSNNGKVRFEVESEDGFPKCIASVNLNNGDELYDEDKYDDVFDIISEIIENDELMIIKNIGVEMGNLEGFSYIYNNLGGKNIIRLDDIYNTSLEDNDTMDDFFDF
jgi:hypothetical protein